MDTSRMNSFLQSSEWNRFLSLAVEKTSLHVANAQILFIGSFFT